MAIPGGCRLISLFVCLLLYKKNKVVQQGFKVVLPELLLASSPLTIRATGGCVGEHVKASTGQLSM